MTPYSLESYPVANAVFYRAYSRVNDNTYESWEESLLRAISGLATLGNLSYLETRMLLENAKACKVLPSGRWLWCGGTSWIAKPENFYGGYNCTSNELNEPKVFGCLMSLAMQGCGTGVILEPRCIHYLPKVSKKLQVEVVGAFNTEVGREETLFDFDFKKDEYQIGVGDSREGWVKAYQALIDLAFDVDDLESSQEVKVRVDISNVRQEGTRLSGFGGTANPSLLVNLFPKVASILNGAYGRKLTAEECCLLIDEAALVVVAGNIRRSAGMRQFQASEKLLKLNLWTQDNQGNWSIDTKKDSLRMANHTRVWHEKPTLDELRQAVNIQFTSGEGAIQYANEAIARANVDILPNRHLQLEFIQALDKGLGEFYLRKMGVTDREELKHRLSRYGLNPCGEIIGSNFFCNLSEVHLNLLNPLDLFEQINFFESAAISVCALLNHEFDNPRWAYSRELDPIIGVSITGLFDFFVNLFGRDWLLWWEQDRTLNFKSAITDKDLEIINRVGVFQLSSKVELFLEVEKFYLRFWKRTVRKAVESYCSKHKIKIPNRYTTVQPAGTKSLLSNASPGWHPPKATRYIRRVTFRKNAPVALALKDSGYSIIPSQSDKDEYGKLLNDPYDVRCTEWLVEIPVEVPWAGEAEGISIADFSVKAQFDFYMQVQKHYTTHNTSATLELREHEIDTLAELIYNSIQKNEGYISAAILARFDASETYPRLPFEPISLEKYNVLVAEVKARKNFYGNKDFLESLNYHAQSYVGDVAPSGCDSDACLMPEAK